MTCDLNSSNRCKKAWNCFELNCEEKKSVIWFIYEAHLQFFLIFSILSVPYDLKNVVHGKKLHFWDKWRCPLSKLHCKYETQISYYTSH